MPSSSTNIPTDPIPWPVQLAALSVGLMAGIAAMIGFVAEWDETFASVQVLWLTSAPVFWMLSSRRKAVRQKVAVAEERWLSDILLSSGAGLVSFVISASIGLAFKDFPPAYHDEYSYLFQAETLLQGRFSTPSSPVHPELFDQMHVLNEGRMASRYYPGTGFWMMPFVAIGHPYLGHWLAGAISTILMYWTARELGGRQVAILASTLMAGSPGIALFGNMLLAHHPTLVGLMTFLLGICRWQRSHSGWDALLAGSGLSFAMLCRPMTAAGVGLPFGIDVLCHVARSLLSNRRIESGNNTNQPTNSGDARLDRLNDGRTLDHESTTTGEMTRRSCVLTILGLGLPLVVGWGIMLAYNRDVTGNWLSSPYQVYTDTYTPSHVYGFNNRLRGEKHLGPKVIEHYDRWAENLTPSLAALNTVTRLIASWIWSVDVLPLVMATIVFLLKWRSTEKPWLLVFASILSLHLAHIPYWYVGIMGWHYVFESAPLWCLLLAFVTSRVQQTWSDSHQNYMSWWWCGLLILSMTGSYVAPGNIWKSKSLRGFHSLLHPRRQQAEFRRWLVASIPQGPALVLVDQQETEASHLDVVSNSPGLSHRILLGRLRPGVTDASKIALDFPSRTVYVCDPTKQSLVRVESHRAQ